MTSIEIQPLSLIIGGLIGVPFAILANVLTPHTRRLWKTMSFRRSSLRVLTNARVIDEMYRTLAMPHHGPMRLASYNLQTIFLAAMAALLFFIAGSAGGWPEYLSVAWSVTFIATVATILILYGSALELAHQAKDPLRTISRCVRGIEREGADPVQTMQRLGYVMNDDTSVELPMLGGQFKLLLRG